MRLPDAVLQRVDELLTKSAGTRIAIAHETPITEGWSAGFGGDPYPWVTRCIVESVDGAGPSSVIVKLRRPETHVRYAPELRHNERAALEFLTSIAGTSGPRLFAAGDEAGILIMEDLGTGPALEDLLVGDDASAAERGLMAFAAALGRLHGDTAGHAAEYYQLRSRLGPVDSIFDRISIVGIGIERAWNQLREIVADRPYLPASKAVSSDIDELLRVLAEPGPYLALSNGDVSPANCRLTSGNVRFIDFEHAAFRHALLDATALRFPFPAVACWSQLPEDMGRRSEDAYRREFGRRCPVVLDDEIYAHGLTAACAAWTIVRMVRLPKLENADAPHPMGFSRRGQLLDNIDTVVNCAQQSGSFSSLATWLTDVDDAMRGRWPHIATTQPFYPAFRSRIST